MNSVESAASLFGSDDAGPDPFAVLGDDAETTIHSTNDVHALADVATPNSSAATVNQLVSDDSGSSAQYSPELGSTLQNVYRYDSSTYSQDPSNSVSYSDQQVQGWYDDHGKWQTHQYPPTQPAEPTQEYIAGQQQSLPSNLYDPYAPRTNKIPLQSSYEPQVPQTRSQQAPSASTSSYTPSQVLSSSQSVYNSYNQSSSDHQVTPDKSVSYPYASAGQSYVSVPKITPSVPAPPAPSAAAYRPKRSNAYDPPLLPPKSSRRAVSTSRPTRTVSPAVGQQTYPVYDASTLPPPPPLPAEYASYTAPHNALSHHSHGPPSFSGSEDSATSYHSVNTWNKHNTTGGHVTADTNGFQITNMSSQCAQGVYAPLSSPPKAPSSGKTDETLTSRQVSGMVSENTDSIHSQSHLQSSSPSQQLFNNTSHGQPHEWTTNITGRSSSPAVEHDFAASARPKSQGSIRHSGNVIANGQNHANTQSSSFAETRPPAQLTSQLTSQSWSKSSRTSPDLHLIRDFNAASSPSNHVAWSNSYDRKVVGRTPSPSNESALRRNGLEGTFDVFAQTNDSAQPSSSSEPTTFTDIHHQKSSLAYIPNGTSSFDSGIPERYAPTPTTKPEDAYEPETHALWQAPVSQNVALDPYAPNAYDSKVTSLTSPLSSWQGPHKTASDPYAPPLKGDTYMPPSAVTNERYPPPQQSVQLSHGAPQFGNSQYTEPSYERLLYNMSVGQEISHTPPTHMPYAPSPSLMGLNDPLGRASARIPVFSFGFGGKVVTCFHGISTLSTGFDVALSSRQSNDIQIRVLHNVIPESALDSSAAVFPGPLFSDPGSPTNSLVRTTASQVKTKKARVSNYLDERVDEIQRGIAYLNPNSDDRRQADAKLVLVKLLKVMLENDGQLSGTSQIDMSVRTALLPRLAEVGGTSPPEGLSTSSLSFSSPMTDSYSGLSLLVPDPGEIPIAVSTLRPSALTKIQELLLRGERRRACHFALDEKLWAHAMVIASSIDKEAWKEVVNEFLRTELGVMNDGHHLPTLPKASETQSHEANGREWIRVAYSLFSGQGPAAVQELLPPNQLSRTTSALQVPMLAASHITPLSPNFPSSSVTANIPAEALSKWPETAAVMVSSPMAPDTSAALTALGDCLVSNGWIEAAHACYLLSPITSPMGGIGSPSTRLVLLGSRRSNFHKDPDPIILSEIAEFAMSLTTPPKGQEPFHGLPHLQAYKLIRAMSLADVGHIGIARRYCEAITSSLGRSSPYFTATFVDQLRGLSDRLVGAPHLDKSGSWIAGKMSKPSLDSIGGWLEGRLTKFIAGDGDVSPVPAQESVLGGEPGVFTHYSTISSATTSASPSPQPSQINTHALSSAPPRRSGSAMAAHSAVSAYAHIDRASSAMEYSRPNARRLSPGPRIVSANASTTTFAQAPSFGLINGYGSANGHMSNYSNDTVTPRSSLDTTNEEESQPHVATWWGSSYVEDSSAPTPTATAFVRVDDAPAPSSASGFISLMDDHSFSVSANPAALRGEPSSANEDDDVEDLGFGNSKKLEKEKAVEESDDKPSEPLAPERPDVKPAQAAGTSSSSGSWLGRFWRRAESTSAPIKASLGEETSFYYDKEQKRWVNKKAGAEEATKPAAPPPRPSRSQTASPGRSNHMSSSPSSLAPPPLRSASAIDLSVSPPSSKAALRVRSNLVPAKSKFSPNTPLSSGLGVAPPSSPGRPKSSVSKRNTRSRYVDILQEEGAK